MVVQFACFPKNLSISISVFISIKKRDTTMATIEYSHHIHYAIMLIE